MKEKIMKKIMIIGLLILSILNVGCSDGRDQTEWNVYYEGTIREKELEIIDVAYRDRQVTRVVLKFEETSRLFTLGELEGYYNIEPGDRGTLHKQGYRNDMNSLFRWDRY